MIQERRPNPAIAHSIYKLENNLPDPPKPPSEPPGSIDRMALGTHPDIVDHLWSIGRSLPRDCSWVAYRQPVLAHFVTGIIFGLGIGTLGYALRLPLHCAAQAEASGATKTRNIKGAEGPWTYSLSDYGSDWWFGIWRPEEDARWSRAAYDHFGAM